MYSFISILFGISFYIFIIISPFIKPIRNHFAYLFDEHYYSIFEIHSDLNRYFAGSRVNIDSILTSYVLIIIFFGAMFSILFTLIWPIVIILIFIMLIVKRALKSTKDNINNKNNILK